MKHYNIEAFSDWGPVHIENPVVAASNFGAALSRGYRLAKKGIKRGPKVVTVRATLIKSP